MVKVKQSFVAKDLGQLPEVAEKLLNFINDRKVVLLYGGMGAGKTTFVKSLGTALNVVDNISSPTYALVNEYHTSNGEIIYHFDMYRIKNDAEAFDMGFEDYLYSGNLCIIEWPEMVTNLLPDNCIKVSIVEEAGGNRLFTFEN
jgi:tRNA threonylcarbamoyladenosine biosynthesis protein TsaE